MDSPRTTPLLREGWRELEEWIDAERRPVENAAGLEAEAGYPERASELVTAFMERVADAALERSHQLLEQIGRSH